MPMQWQFWKCPRFVFQYLQQTCQSLFKTMHCGQFFTFSKFLFFSDSFHPTCTLSSVNNMLDYCLQSLKDFLLKENGELYKADFVVAIATVF